MERFQAVAPPEAQGIHPALRAATAAQHATIETLLGLRQPFDRAHYVRVLQGFGAFLAAWEPRMAAVLPAHLQAWFTEGRRAHLVQGDLAALGVAPSPTPAIVPALDSLGAALGSLYVLEGSALGGQFIAAQARRHLGLTPATGAAYFHGCGTGTMARWREFCALLARELETLPHQRDAAVQAARATFEGLADTFRALLEPRERTPA